MPNAEEVAEIEGLEIDDEIVEEEHEELSELEDGVEETEDKTEATDTVETEEDDDEIVVSIGEAEPEEKEVEEAPEWVRNLRKDNRDLKRKVKEYERTTQQAAPDAIVVGKEPEMSDDGIDYDGDLFKEKWSAWKVRKDAAEKQGEQAKASQEQEAQAWQNTLTSYNEKKTILKAKTKGYDEAEEMVKETLSIDQQSVILIGADNPALMVIALGKNPEKMRELASITDPIRFSIAIGKLETQLKTSKGKKPTTKPEGSIKGSGAVATSTDKTLDRLEKEADKTGNRSKVIAFKKAQKDKAA